jgi:hypothetical protein
MHISKKEHHIVKLLFHPRIINSGKTHYTGVNGNTKHLKRIEFASRRRNNTAAGINLLEWIQKDKLIKLARDWAVVDVTETKVLALDMVFSRPYGTADGVSHLIMCTVVTDCRASKRDIQRAYDHTCKIHNTLNKFYHIPCQSVLLIWGVGNSFSEVWFRE